MENVNEVKEFLLYRRNVFKTIIDPENKNFNHIIKQYNGKAEIKKELFKFDNRIKSLKKRILK